jgi:hypothetical protein
MLLLAERDPELLLLQVLLTRVAVARAAVAG